MVDVVFRPIAQAVAAASGQITDEATAGFVPMGLFDTSELHQAADNLLEEHEPAVEPEGIFLTEEDLQHRLHESFQNGVLEGKNLAERGLLNVFRALRSAAEAVQDLREKVMRESEDELVELVMMVARKVILREVAQDRGIMFNMVQAGIGALSDRDELTIRLNPDDYTVVTTDHEDHFRKELITDRMRIKPDPTILVGGCQIDSELGTLDASIDAQLEEIYRHLLEERNLSAGAGA